MGQREMLADGSARFQGVISRDSDIGEYIPTFPLSSYGAAWSSEFLGILLAHFVSRPKDVSRTASALRPLMYR
jgi:hypothetical protein